MSDCKLIHQSVLIVEAELVGKTEILLADKLTRAEPAMLKVSKVFKGNRQLADILIHQPKSSAPISSSDIFYQQGQKGIWFLTEGKHTDSGIYYADNPQRFRTIQPSESISALINSCNKD